MKLPILQTSDSSVSTTPAPAHQVFGGGEVDATLVGEVLARQGLSMGHTVLMLPYGANNRIGFETRRLYFALALTGATGRFNTEPVLRGSSLDDQKSLLPVTRIFSFGDCNVACPYCKRDCQFLGDDGKPIVAVRLPVIELFKLAEAAHARGETVRFSGGDPVLFPKETVAVSEYMARKYGAKTSIAHNGTGPAWVRKILPYLESAAIDLKAVPEKIGAVMGVSREQGEKLYKLTLQTQQLIADAGTCLLDVRTPVFGDTPLEDMLRLGEEVARLDPSVTFWTWRMYKAVEGCEWPTPEKERMFEMMATVSSRMPDHWIGVRAKWEKGGMIYFKGGHQVNHEEIDDAEARGSGNRLAA